MKAPTHHVNSRPQQGYVLLTLLLFVTLLVISAAVIAESITMQIRREREEELIHRAAEYRRAVRLYTKQTGRFPMKLEDLENTSGVRYLRRRYTDPITGKDFRVLHMGELPAAIGTSSTAWSLQPSPSGEGSATSKESSDLPAPVPAETSDPAPPAQASSGFAASPNPGTPTGSSASSLPGGPTFSGGVIIGVASTSPKKTIREFNQKSHYNEWLFFYDPTFDRGFEVQGPTPLTRAPAALQGPPNSSTAGTQPSAPQTPPAATQQ
ncbi:MAG: hypothetical protein WCA16_04065 [Candidatus Sulfotelmatobacter sp.]